MEISNSIAMLAIVISIVALVVPYLTYKREEKQANQDIIFQEKVNAYKAITHESFTIYQNYFDLVNKVQFYEGTEDEWENTVLKEVTSFYHLSFDLKKSLYSYSVLLPSNIFKEAEELSESFLGFVTNATHCNSRIIIESYEHIGNKLYKLVDLIRKDLNVDVLNTELSNRIK